LRVAELTREAGNCVLLTLVHARDGTLPPSEAGAHIGLHLPNGMERQYSLLHAAAEPESYRIAVKLDPAGRGGSRYLVERVSVGDVIEADPPRNNFPLREDADTSVLIAGGIGITPIMPMIEVLDAGQKAWTLHYAARTRSEAPFIEALQGDPRVRLHFDDQMGGVLGIAEIVNSAPPKAHLYCCGPGPMLAAFEAAAREARVPPDQAHVEYFTPKFARSTDGGFSVVLARTGGEVRPVKGQSILDALRAHGLELASSCEEGICGACETRVLEGIPDHRDAILTERERQENKTMFICCSGSKTERLVLDL
jgi:ferredoxin-NADP reductase